MISHTYAQHATCNFCQDRGRQRSCWRPRMRIRFRKTISYVCHRVFVPTHVSTCSTRCVGANLCSFASKFSLTRCIGYRLTKDASSTHLRSHCSERRTPVCKARGRRLRATRPVPTPPRRMPAVVREVQGCCEERREAQEATVRNHREDRHRGGHRARKAASAGLNRRAVRRDPRTKRPHGAVLRLSGCVASSLGLLCTRC